MKTYPKIKSDILRAGRFVSTGCGKSRKSKIIDQLAGTFDTYVATVKKINAKKCFGELKKIIIEHLFHL